MLLYRVFACDRSAKPGAPGHATFLIKPQFRGRWSNPHLYDAWYLGRSPEAAIGETFGNFEYWSEAMFTRPYGQMLLAVFSVPDTLPICDLDDSNNLLTLGMRPSQLVIRNEPYTQARAAALFQQNNWAGLDGGLFTGHTGRM